MFHLQYNPRVLIVSSIAMSMALSQISGRYRVRQIDPGVHPPPPLTRGPSPRQSRANLCRGRAALSPVASTPRASTTSVPVCVWVTPLNYSVSIRLRRCDACLASESPDCLSCANEYVCSWALLLFPGDCRSYRSWMLYSILIRLPWLIVINEVPTHGFAFIRCLHVYFLV